MRNLGILKKEKNNLEKIEKSSAENFSVDEKFINKYISLTKNIDELKKKQAEMNSEIKNYLVKNNLKDIKTEEGGVKLVVSNKTSFDEEKLLTFLKENKIDAVKSVEVIDEEKLEKLIYDGNLDAKLLEPYQKTTTINTLRLIK